VSYITPRLLNQKFVELRDIYEHMATPVGLQNEDEEGELEDYNRLVEDLGEEASKVDLLRKQYLEREEKALRAKKRLHQQMQERR
jgi:hypothetical protein